MMIFAAISGWFGGVWNWIAKNPAAQAIAAGVGVIVGWSLLRMKLEHDGAQNQKLKNAVESANQTVAVVKAGHEEIRDIEHAKDAALAAPPAVPVVSSADELRVKAPDIANVILRPRGEGNVSGR